MKMRSTTSHSGAAHGRTIRALALGSLAAALAWACSAERPRATGEQEIIGAPSPGDVCGVPNEGCPCDVDGQVAACGKVKQTIGSYVECANGQMTCSGGKWGTCDASEGLTKTQSFGSGLGIRALAQDAGPCSNPCNPYCSRYSDTPSGIELTPDSGLQLTDGGLSLVPVPPQGAECTSLTIAASTRSMVVTSLSPLAATPNAVTFTPTFLPAGCATPGTQPTWVVDAPTSSSISRTGVFTLGDAVAGTVTVRAFFAASSGVLTSNAVPIDVSVRVTVPSSVPPNAAATTTQIGRFFVDPGWTTPATGTVSSNATWLYPYADTWFPMGLLAPVIQYKVTASPGQVVKTSLRFPVGATATNALFDYSFFAGERSNFYPNRDNFPTGPAADSNDSQVVIPQAAWRAFERSAKGSDAELIIQRWTPNTLQNENRQRIHIADGQLKGTVYYGSYNSPLAGNTGAVLAIRPGASAPVVAAQNNGRCTVCHSVNSKGDFLVANGNGSGTYSYDAARRYSIAANATPVNDYGSNAFAYGGPYPDGTFYMSHRGDDNWHIHSSNSTLYRTSNASTITLANWPSNMQAVTPAFSSDGTKLAFGFWAGSRIQNAGPSASKARLVVADFNCGAVNGSCTSPSGWSVTNARDLTPGNSNIVGWPSFLPDGKAVLYQQVITAANGAWSPSEINTIAGGLDEIWISSVPATSATTASNRRLNALNGLTSAGKSYLPTSARDVAPLRPNYHGNGVSVSWRTDGCAGPYTALDVSDTRLNYLPRVSPKDAGGVYWVVFSSRRMYGNVAWDNPWASQGAGCRSTEVPTQKLWVAAIDKNWNGTSDPSHPAFYLPGQELLAGNNKGYWVDSPCAPSGEACDTTADCCQAPSAQVCRLDTSSSAKRCEAASACVGVGGACTTNEECCGNGSQCFGATPSSPGVCAMNQSYSTATFTRDYEAPCGVGTRPRWQLFRWQGTIPSGTTVSFFAQTASRLPDGGTTAWSAAVPVGVADATTSGWTSGPQTVETALKAAGIVPGDRLRITMIFDAGGESESPVLSQWDQLVDCVASE